MIDPVTQAVLQRIIRREGRSLLQYVSESFPWTAPGENGAVVRLREIAAEENNSTAALVRYVSKRRMTPPYLGAYPMAFTNINYLSLAHLLPHLAEAQKRAIAELEADLAKLNDEEARAYLRNILDMKRRHEKELERLKSAPAAAPPPTPAVTSH